MWVLLGPISNPTVRLPWRSWGTELTGTRPPRSCSRLSARPRGLVRVMIPWGGGACRMLPRLVAGEFCGTGCVLVERGAKAEAGYGAPEFGFHSPHPL